MTWQRICGVRPRLCTCALISAFATAWTRLSADAGANAAFSTPNLLPPRSEAEHTSSTSANVSVLDGGAAC
eukprot:4517603-Prymnesium_polylepis.2